MGIVMSTVLSSSEWVVPALLLFVVAWNKFDGPPTNRSGTTFALFFFGVIFYYALILALWLLVSVSGIGFGRLLSLADRTCARACSSTLPFSQRSSSLSRRNFPE